MSNSIVKGPPYSFFYPIPCRIHRRRVGFALLCTKAQVWLAFFHIPCRIHRRLSFWTHTIHLLRYTLNTCHQPKKTFEPISSEHSNANLPIKVFPWKRRAQIGDVASRALNQGFSKHTNTHWWLSHTKRGQSPYNCKWWWSSATTRLEFWPQTVATFKPWTSQTSKSFHRQAFCREKHLHVCCASCAPKRSEMRNKHWRREKGPPQLTNTGGQEAKARQLYNVQYI